MLSAGETRAAESLLAAAWGKPVTVLSAQEIWNRSHILRLTLADGGTAVLKRDRDAGSRELTWGFPAERAALEFLRDMDPAVAPRLFGATVLDVEAGLGAEAGLLVMEDLGPAVSLAHSLLGGDPGRAEADLIAYARALGAMHAWSSGRGDEFAELAARDGHPVRETPWTGAITRDKAAFIGLAERLGVPAKGVAAEIDSLGELLRGPGDAYTGLVHGDACPDNTQLSGGSCRIFDFETAGWGPVAFDAAYLLAPFPSCWCFAALPADVAGRALDAYRDQVTAAGVTLGPDWDAALTAALAGWCVARAPMFGRALDRDGEWGTTTARPRTLTWLRSFAEAAARTDVLPRLQTLAEALGEQFTVRWPGTAVPDYPALARPGAPLAQPPDDWESV